MNNYFSFYGLLDEYVENKRLTPFQNNFIEKKASLLLFDRLFSSLKNFKYWVLSYNNKSYPSKEEILQIISKYSTDIKVLEKPYVYQTTGKENKKNNREYLFIVTNPNFIIY